MATSGAKHKSSVAIVLALVVAAELSFSGFGSAEWLGESRPMMGTQVSVHLWHSDAAEGKRCIDRAFAEMSRIDELMSTYRPDSRISHVNANAAAMEVEVGYELYRLIEVSIEVSEMTAGTFDMTFVVWHVSHADVETTSLQVVIEE